MTERRMKELQIYYTQNLGCVGTVAADGDRDLHWPLRNQSPQAFKPMAWCASMDTRPSGIGYLSGQSESVHPLYLLLELILDQPMLGQRRFPGECLGRNGDLVHLAATAWTQ
jgi:hypothetical protein